MRAFVLGALFITACSSPPPPPPPPPRTHEVAGRPRVDSSHASPATEEQAESDEQAAAHARRWAECVFRETGGDWEKESIAEYNCRSDLPNVYALNDYAKTLPYDSARVLLEVFGGVERRP